MAIGNARPDACTMAAGVTDGGRRGRIAATVVILIVTAAVLGGVCTQWPDAASCSRVFSDAMAVPSGSASPIELDGLAPGGFADGRMTVSNHGDGPGRFTLLARVAATTAGRGGVALADVLRLEVVDVTDPAAPVRVFRGRLTELRADLGTFAAHSSRRYEYRVALPSAAASPDALAGSSLSVAFDWVAVTGG